LKIQSFSYGNLDTFTTGNHRTSDQRQARYNASSIFLRIGIALDVDDRQFDLDTRTSQQLITMIPLLLITRSSSFSSASRWSRSFAVQQKLDWLNTVLQENIAGARLVKAFVRADYESERFEAANEDFTERTIRVTQFMSSMSPR
jgi:ATP-binding cassette subfamily B protein